MGLSFGALVASSASDSDVVLSAASSSTGVTSGGGDGVASRKLEPDANWAWVGGLTLGAIRSDESNAFSASTSAFHTVVRSSEANQSTLAVRFEAVELRDDFIALGEQAPPSPGWL